MGYRLWGEGSVFVVVFLVIIAIPCVLISIYGSRMVNDIGNAPTKSATIQAAATWKVFIAEIFSFALLAVFFHIFK